MSVYKPEGWVIIKMVSPDELLYKVFGSWFGYWKFNSGVVSVRQERGDIVVKGFSGSEYLLQPSLEGVLTVYNRGVLDRFITSINDGPLEWTAEVVPVDVMLDYFRQE